MTDAFVEALGRRVPGQAQDLSAADPGQASGAGTQQEAERSEG